MPIKSVTITYDDVAAIIQRHLNDTLFVTPVRVTRVDPWDWDIDDERQFAISIEPLAVAPVPAAELAASMPIIAAPNGHANGNGNGHAPVTTVTPELPAVVSQPQEATQAAPAAEASKSRRLTDHERQRILDLTAEGGHTVKTIAGLVHCSEATVYDVRAAARARTA